MTINTEIKTWEDRAEAEHGFLPGDAWKAVYMQAEIADLRAALEAHRKCHKCNGNGLTHAGFCPLYDKEKNLAYMAEWKSAQALQPVGAVVADEMIQQLAMAHGVISFHVDPKLIAFSRALIALASQPAKPADVGGVVLKEKIVMLLNGINKEECEDNAGWWEASSGAEFGAKVLADILSLIDSTLAAKTAAPEESRIKALYDVVGRIISGDGDLNLTRLHDYLGGEEGLSADTILCDDTQTVAPRQSPNATGDEKFQRLAETHRYILNSRSRAEEQKDLRGNFSIGADPLFEPIVATLCWEAVAVGSDDLLYATVLEEFFNKSLNDHFAALTAPVAPVDPSGITMYFGYELKDKNTKVYLAEQIHALLANSKG